MPVLIEGVCVLLKKGSVIKRYQGGYSQFLFDLHDQSKLIESNQLLSMSFNNHEEARNYLQFIAQKGLKIIKINEDDPHNTDALLVDQVFGPSFRVYWLDFIHLGANPHSKARQSSKNKGAGQKTKWVMMSISSLQPQTKSLMRRRRSDYSDGVGKKSPSPKIGNSKPQSLWT